MKHFFPLILILILILTGCSVSKPEAAYKQLSASEAMDLMESEKDYIILDVRTIKNITKVTYRMQSAYQTKPLAQRNLPSFLIRIN